MATADTKCRNCGMTLVQHYSPPLAPHLPPPALGHCVGFASEPEPPSVLDAIQTYRQDALQRLRDRLLEASTETLDGEEIIFLHDVDRIFDEEMGR